MNSSDKNRSLQRKKLCHSSQLYSRMMLIESKFILDNDTTTKNVRDNWNDGCNFRNICFHMNGKWKKMRQNRSKSRFWLFL